MVSMWVYFHKYKYIHTCIYTYYTGLGFYGFEVRCIVFRCIDIFTHAIILTFNPEHY